MISVLVNQSQGPRFETVRLPAPLKNLKVGDEIEICPFLRISHLFILKFSISGHRFD